MVQGKPINTKLLIARICHVYGQTPDVILGLAYPHFLLLAENLDAVEGYRAYYQALAFHNPEEISKKLFPDGEISDEDELTEEEYSANRHRLAALMGMAG